MRIGHLKYSLSLSFSVTVYLMIHGILIMCDSMLKELFTSSSLSLRCPILTSIFFIEYPAGRGAAMIIESLSLCYHVWCFTCAVCGAALGDGRAGADVRVRARRLHCHHCYSGDDGRKYSCV